MKIFYIIIILFISFKIAAEENIIFNPYKQIFNTLGYPIKYCEKFLFSTNRVQSNENKTGIIKATDTLFNNKYYLKEYFSQGSIANAIFTILPESLENCGKYIYTEDQFYIKYLNNEFSIKNYLKNDGNGNYFLEEKGLMPKDYENYLFSLRSTDNFILPTNYSYVLNQRINNNFSVFHCDRSDWCSAKNIFENFILKLNPVVNQTYGKAKVPVD
ncbi:hypothetical protein [Silvanigrella sp.]|jgi:hypothetical protein|uniref:hypothetical protein n=1 Tax=Silvanigrella sp. TaxID=2024976 RepID=UPI0037CC87B3